MDHIGEYDGWQIYRNSEGFLEGYNPERIVTNQKTVGGFINFIDGREKKMQD